MNLREKILNIQTELKAPKDQYNDFGKYKYRSCEGILEAVKPLNAKYGVALLIKDEIKQYGDRFYVESSAILIDTESDETLTVTALAREEQSKKGMDSSQITGSSSSYARKYALNGMYAIDDTKDADTKNNGDSTTKPLDWRNEFIKLCKIKGINSVDFAAQNGINKDTTQAEFKEICERLSK